MAELLPIKRITLFNQSNFNRNFSGLSGRARKHRPSSAGKPREVTVGSNLKAYITKSPVRSSKMRSVRPLLKLRSLPTRIRTHHSPNIHLRYGQKGQTCIGCTSQANQEDVFHMGPHHLCWLPLCIVR